MEPGKNSYYWIETISNLLAGSKTLFLIDDIIANENLDKQRQLLLESAISGRHGGHLLWLLTQSYTAVPEDIRRQTKIDAVCLVSKESNGHERYSQRDVNEC